MMKSALKIAIVLALVLIPRRSSKKPVKPHQKDKRHATAD